MELITTSRVPRNILWFCFLCVIDAIFSCVILDFLYFLSLKLYHAVETSFRFSMLMHVAAAGGLLESLAVWLKKLLFSWTGTINTRWFLYFFMTDS